MNMRLNRGFFYFILVVFAFCGIASCKNENKDNLSNTKIASFSLSNDSIKGVDGIVFTIDNDSNLIYNIDSASYGIKVDSVRPVIGWNYLSSVIINDSIVYDQKNDSLYLDFSKPVKIHTVSSDQKSTRDYIVKTTVHQVNPDEYVWRGMNTEIYKETPLGEKAFIVGNGLKLIVKTAAGFRCYSSEDAAVWTGADITGLPTDAIPEWTISSGYRLYYAKGNKIYFSVDGIAWTVADASVDVNVLLFSMNGEIYANAKIDGEDCIAKCGAEDFTFTKLASLPTGFPVSGMGVCVADAPGGKERAFIVGGRDAGGVLLNSLWSTENGSYWSNLTLGRNWFTPREHVAIIQYADGIVLFGGKDDSGICEDFQLYSPDYGLTWGEADDAAKISSLYVPRYNISASTTEDGYIYLVGGQTSETDYIKNAWMGLRYASMPGFRK